MGFMKRRKQPHLYRDPSIDPTREVAINLAAVAAKGYADITAAVVKSVVAKPRPKTAKKAAKKGRHR